MEYKNTTEAMDIQYSVLGLNPCFNGIQKYIKRNELIIFRPVLILVLMEYKNTTTAVGKSSNFVLILVLMEYKNTVCKSIS